MAVHGDGRSVKTYRGKKIPGHLADLFPGPSVPVMVRGYSQGRQFRVSPYRFEAKSVTVEHWGDRQGTNPTIFYSLCCVIAAQSFKSSPLITALAPLQLRRMQ